MNMLENDRVLLRSNILYSFSWCSDRIIELCIDFLDKTTGQEPFFRDDYRKEIDPLLGFFNRLMRPQSLYSNALWSIFSHDTLTGKRVLQQVL